MNERQLRYAIAVRDERGFSRAAKRLRLSQPSISQQVMLLEEELGFPLFLRSMNDVSVTFLGRKFLAQAEQALGSMSGLHDVARQLRHGADQSLSLGVSSGISPFAVPLALESLHPPLTKTRLELVTAPSPKVQRMVLQDALELGIVVEIHPHRILPELHRECVGEIDMAIFVPPGHRLSQKAGGVEMDELLAEALVINEPRAGYGELVQSMFTDRGLQPNVVAISDCVGATKLMVRAGVGVAILPALSAPDETREGSLVRIPLKSTRTISIDLVHRAAQDNSSFKAARMAISNLFRKRLKTETTARAVA
jgi:DNA-binding transcriptional LysR family regulator